MATLARGVRAWLVQLYQGPQKPPRTRTSQRARELGLAAREVMYQGREMTTKEAAQLSPVWWRDAQYTGRDRITEAGLRVLAIPG